MLQDRRGPRECQATQAIFLWKSAVAGDHLACDLQAVSNREPLDPAEQAAQALALDKLHGDYHNLPETMQVIGAPNIYVSDFAG